MKKFIVFMALVLFVDHTSSQSSDDDLAMMEAMFMASADSGEMDQVGQACVNKMNNKGWQEISTNKRGEKEYYIVGVGTVSAPLQSSAFADSALLKPLAIEVSNNEHASSEIPNFK